jgi:hypothetical protein
MATLVNLTPHEIVIVGADGAVLARIAPSGQVARCTPTTVEVSGVGGVPVVKTTLGAVEGLPAPQDGVVYITSSLVAQRAAADGVPMDLKTSSKSWGSDKAQNETQSLFYLAALMQAGNTAHQMRFRHIVLVKTKTPQIQILESSFTIGNIFWLLEMISKVWNAINEGHFPYNPIGWKCSEAWCEYWSMCRGRT